MIGVLTAIAIAVGVAALFFSMASGQRFAKRFGLRRLQKDAAPDEDRDFLLSACGGDSAAAAACLDAVRERYPDWTEAQLYRRAIRGVMNERRHAGNADG